ncbi:MAG: hypothetical protein IKV85_04165 [Ruminococcus sp.]|nr:hypothetical protein [Ruminococcus sp.]
MQIVENQNLYFDNVLSYVSGMDNTQTMGLVNHILKNLESIGLEVREKVMFTYSDSETEFLIPLKNEKTYENSGYRIKPKFKMINAVKIRFEGDFGDIDIALKALEKYISEKKYRVISRPYYVVVRSNVNSNSGIWDIYISIDGNIF